MRLKNEVTELDKSTGELTTISKTYSIKVKDQEEFYLTFAGFMQYVFKVKSIIDIQVLTQFCMMMEYGTNRVFLPTVRRRELCEKTGLANSHLSNSIKRLQDLKIITGSGGVYDVNPIFFWKGTIESRANALKTPGLSFTINFGGPDGNND